MYADILREWYLCVYWLCFLSLSRSPAVDGAFASLLVTCCDSMVHRSGRMTRTAPEVGTAGPKAPAGRRARILQRLHGPPAGAYDAHGTRGGHRGSKG